MCYLSKLGLVTPSQLEIPHNLLLATRFCCTRTRVIDGIAFSRSYLFANPQSGFTARDYASLSYPFSRHPSTLEAYIGCAPSRATKIRL